MNEYKMPDPVKDPVACLVLAYKVTKGFPHDDRSWDRIHFFRNSKPAKALIEICGSVRMADNCMMELSRQFEEKELNWTLETIVKHAHEWMLKKRGSQNGNIQLRARFFKALTDRDRSPDSPEAIEGIAALPDAPRSGLPVKTGN